MNPIGKLSISSLPSVYFDGNYFVLSCVPETVESVKPFPTFGSHPIMAVAPLDPSQWQEIDLEWYNNPIWNQGMTSSCTGHGTNAGMQMCYMQSGRPLVQFNPFFTYGLVNGGRDAGAMISDCLNALIKSGACPHDDLQPGMMFQSQFPQKAFDDAKRFKLEKAYKCANFNEICSAISLGFVCPLGLYVDQNFTNLDSEGVAGLPNGSQGGGHCVLGMGLKKSARYGWVIKFQNSWGSNYGKNGHAYLQKMHLNRMNTDAFAIQTIIDDPQDNNPNDNVPVVS